MLKRGLHKLLTRFGKSYEIDKAIPNRLIISIIFSRVIMLIRGIIKTRRLIFLGRGVHISYKRNFVFGSGCTIEKRCKLDAYSSEKIKFGNSVKIGAYSTISVTSHLSSFGKGLHIGSFSAVGEYSYFGCSGGLVIGDNVIMGQYISFHTQNHVFKHKDKLIREQGVTSEGILIGNNIWVGAKVTFLDGCVVGDNSVVAAGSVVRGKFPDNVVIGGVPARILKKL